MGKSSSTREPSSVAGSSSKVSSTGHQHCSSWRSALSPGDTDKLRAAYNIFDDIAIRIPYADAGVDPNDTIHEVCVYKQMFKAGVYFSLLPEV
jgi:hypothetical protein